MADSDRNTRLSSAHPFQRFKSEGPFTPSKSAIPQLQRKLKQQSFVVLYVDENCPLHGSQGKCTCASFVSNDDDGVDNNGMGSSDSLHRSGDFDQQRYKSNDNLFSPSIKRFSYKPLLPNIHGETVDNNLHHNSSSQKDDSIDDENDHLAALLLYRDALKKKLTPAKDSAGFPRMRHGRIGSQWRHIKQTNTYAGSNLMFIDGSVRIDDSIKYPIPRFGYPPLKRPQHKFSSSYNDLSVTSLNPATKSLDTFTGSPTNTLNQHPSLAQYSNRFQRHAKDNFSYWPTNIAQKKPLSKTTTTGTYKAWLGD